MSIFGRGEVLAGLRALVDRTLTDRAGCVARIIANSGYGKTTVLHALLREFERRDDVVIFQATCNSDMESSPRSALTALLESQSQALRIRRPEYVAGLEELFADENHAIPRERMELAFSRLCDALLTDLAVIFAVDDGQWMDAESATILRRICATGRSKPLALLLAQRPAATPAIQHGLKSTDFTLAALDRSAIESLVRQIYPAADSALIDAISAASAGVPLTATVLAQHASEGTFTASLTQTIARDIASMHRITREVLSACSLLREPVRYILLRKLWDEDSLLDALSEATGRYLLQLSDGFSFVHSLVREAISENITLSAPLQQKLLDALRSLEQPTMAELRDTVDLSARTGDRNLLATSALALARAAAGRREWELAAEAYGSALPLLEPGPQHLREYLQYADTLRLLERDDVARDFLEPVVAAFVQNGFEGAGALTGTLANVLWSLQQRAAALSVCEEALLRLPDGNDRDELESRYLALRLMQSARLPEPLEDRIAHLTAASDRPGVARRLLSARIVSATVHGDVETARDLLGRLKVYEDYSSPLAPQYTEVSNIYFDLHERGPAAIRARALEGFHKSESSPGFYLALVTYVDFAMGKWREALDRVLEAGVDRYSRAGRIQVLIPCAAILALRDEPHAVGALVKTEAEDGFRLLRVGESAELCLWYAVGARDRTLSAAELAYLIEWVKAVRDADTIFSIPAGAALLSKRLRSDELYAAASRRCDGAQSKWLAAHADLRVGIACSDATLLKRAYRAFKVLGADALAGLAEGRTTRRSADFRKELTPRESTICELVFKGMTNREIAGQLFLSERTVETHVSSALGKFGARSRTELIVKIAQHQHTNLPYFDPEPEVRA